LESVDSADSGVLVDGMTSGARSFLGSTNNRY
jgi:hypothetical protein